MPQRDSAGELRYACAVRLASAAKGDAARLQTIYAECVGNAEWLPPTARELIDFAAVSVGEEIYVAERADGDLVGFVSVQAAEGYVHHLYVREAARGCGVARQLLLALRAPHPKPWRLKCVLSNHRALAVYRALDWVEVGRGEGEHGAYVVMAWQPSS